MSTKTALTVFTRRPFKYVNGEPVKVCTHCKRALPATTKHFTWERSKSATGTGVILLRSCRECENGRSRERYVRQNGGDPDWRAEQKSQRSYESMLRRLNQKAMEAK